LGGSTTDGGEKGKNKAILDVKPPGVRSRGCGVPAWRNGEFGKKKRAPKYGGIGKKKGRLRGYIAKPWNDCSTGYRSVGKEQGETADLDTGCWRWELGKKDGKIPEADMRNIRRGDGTARATSKEIPG